MTLARLKTALATLVIVSALHTAAVPPAAVAHHNSDWVIEIIQERAAYHGVSAGYLSRIIRCESSYHPGAVGAAGELGLAQLHPRGLLPHFYRVGYSTPFSAWESIDYLARVMSGEWVNGGVGLSHWTCA